MPFYWKEDEEYPAIHLVADISPPCREIFVACFTPFFGLKKFLHERERVGWEAVVLFGCCGKQKHACWEESFLYWG